jgi:hypothetical protein
MNNRLQLQNTINYYSEENQIIQSLLQEDLDLTETSIEQYQIILNQNNVVIHQFSSLLFSIIK